MDLLRTTSFYSLANYEKFSSYITMSQSPSQIVS